MPSCAAMAPIAQHRGGDAQLACDLDQRPTAARQQGDRLPLELIRKMTPFLTHSTPFRSRRSLAKVSTNSGEAQIRYGTHSRSRPFSAALLPEAVDDYVAADNPVRFIEAFVDGLDLAALGFIGTVPKATGRPVTRARHWPGPWQAPKMPAAAFQSAALSSSQSLRIRSFYGGSDGLRRLIARRLPGVGIRRLVSGSCRGRRGACKYLQ